MTGGTFKRSEAKLVGVPRDEVNLLQPNGMLVKHPQTAPLWGFV